ncbi:5-formyltetrahydrofolate cyclo-ligase [Lichenifustis flavocetrariae]|uniref:5-formyltetrahydrofolate cyclo-ligase n=1 Tax=Lichenifustis flavocetrariae TaxID=2949735 RepID=A0AA41Z611_9HYPH|nr:5-formyltetrahydrofolate cyclo-ligase [Lichenifustis flavocetrariae]MCW6509927.1 5-formyltetrahydrofolate cyclo-ligase [Lichenifustis flavocetrariae]
MHDLKDELRKAGLKARDGIDPAAREQFANRLAEVGPRLVFDFRRAGEPPVVSLFSPIGSEPGMLPLARALNAAGVRLVLPVDWSHGSPLVYRSWDPEDRLSVGPLGIREPVEHAPELEPDVLFIPASVFDRRGFRLGYGAGNVDRTLRALRARKTIRAIGVAYAVQEHMLVPTESHDEPLDVVVTDHDILFCAKPRQ